MKPSKKPISTVQSAFARLPASTGVLLAMCLFFAPLHAGQAQETRLRIESAPPGARAVLDGVVLQGITPLTTPVPAPGKHILHLEKENHETVKEAFSLSPGERKLIELSLPPVRGLVLLHSIPPGAVAVINGRERGETPLLITDLPVGNHALRLESTGLPVRDYTLSVRSRIPTKIVYRLAEATMPPPAPRTDAPQPETPAALPREPEAAPVTAPEAGAGNIGPSSGSIDPGFRPNYEIITRSDRRIQGRFQDIDTDGNIRIEISPGTIREVPAGTIRLRRHLRGSGG